MIGLLQILKNEDSNFQKNTYFLFDNLTAHTSKLFFSTF